MRANSVLKKLQRAILQSGLVVSVNTTQFFSSEQKRFITIYLLTTPTWYQNKKGEWKRENYKIMSTASIRDAVECLNEIRMQVSKWQE